MRQPFLLSPAPKIFTFSGLLFFLPPTQCYHILYTPYLSSFFFFFFLSPTRLSISSFSPIFLMLTPTFFIAINVVRDTEAAGLKKINAESFAGVSQRCLEGATLAPVLDQPLIGRFPKGGRLDTSEATEATATHLANDAVRSSSLQRIAGNDPLSFLSCPFYSIKYLYGIITILSEFYC